MKNKTKIIGVLLAVLVFMVFTVASGSDSKKATQNPGSNDPTGSAGTTTSSPKNEEKIEYTITDSGVNVRTTSLDTKRLSAYVAVKNTGNTNLYLSSSSIDIETAEGTFVQTLKLVSVYPQVIKPGETAYYYDTESLEGEITEGLKVAPHVKAEKATVECIRLNVSETQLKDEMFLGGRLAGRVENNTESKQSSIYVVAHFFDKDGKFIGHQFTILSDEIAPGEKYGFETSNLSTDFKAEDVGNYEVYAYPYQYQFGW